MSCVPGPQEVEEKLGRIWFFIQTVALRLEGRSFLFTYIFFFTKFLTKKKYSSGFSHGPDVHGRANYTINEYKPLRIKIRTEILEDIFATIHQSLWFFAPQLPDTSIEMYNTPVDVYLLADPPRRVYTFFFSFPSYFTHYPTSR